MAIDDSLLTGIGSDNIQTVILDWQNETIVKLQKSLDEKASSGTSLKLRQSIQPRKLEQTENGLLMVIEAEDYYKYIDEGVRGVGGEKKGGGIFQQVAPNSPFSYKKGSKPSVKHFEQWARIKGLNPFAVRESVFRKGLTPNFFFSSVMTNEWINELSTRLEEVGANNIEVILKNSIEQ